MSNNSVKIGRCVVTKCNTGWRINVTSVKTPTTSTEYFETTADKVLARICASAGWLVKIDDDSYVVAALTNSLTFYVLYKNESLAYPAQNVDELLQWVLDWYTKKQEGETNNSSADNKPDECFKVLGVDVWVNAQGLVRALSSKGSAVASWTPWISKSDALAHILLNNSSLFVPMHRGKPVEVMYLGGKITPSCMGKPLTEKEGNELFNSYSLQPPQVDLENNRVHWGVRVQPVSWQSLEKGGNHWLSPDAIYYAGNPGLGSNALNKTGNVGLDSDAVGDPSKYAVTPEGMKVAPGSSWDNMRGDGAQVESPEEAAKQAVTKEMPDAIFDFELVYELAAFMQATTLQCERAIEGVVAALQKDDVKAAGALRAGMQTDDCFFKEVVNLLQLAWQHNTPTTVDDLINQFKEQCSYLAASRIYRGKIQQLQETKDLISALKI